MAKNYLTSSRHGTVFYFRRRVPDDLRQIIGKPCLVKTLRTCERGRAIILARAYAAKTDVIFEHLRSMNKKSDKGFIVDYTFELELDDLGSVRKIKVEANPDESVAVEGAIRTALTNLPRHGGEARTAAPASPSISTDELFEDFFREGIALDRWKAPLIIRQHDYEPVWKKFRTHAATLGLTLAAAKSYRTEVLSQDVAINTKVRNLSRVHSVISHGIAHHQLDERMLTPLKLSSAQSKSRGGKTKHYLPFSSDDLIALFHSHDYRQHSFKKPSQFWMPLIGLYTGARIDELAALSLSAFRTEDGIPAVMLSDVDTTDGGKNEHSPRLVPIHQQLLGLGLLQYVEKLKLAGHQRLFPDIGKAFRDGFGKRTTDDFIAYRRSVGVGKGKGERSQQVFHSFRSTLAVKFFQIGIDGDLSRRLTGHAAIDVHQGTYLAAASIPMPRARDAMNSVNFNLTHAPFVDTAAYEKARNRVRSTPADQK